MRISEIYRSVQGEGPRVGEPTIFVRAAGCNLRCPGWPCDTPHAIDPQRFRQTWELLTHYEVASRVHQAGKPYHNVCFTGGEPFLQNEHELKDIIDLLRTSGYTNFEVFTNGTLPFPEWTSEFLYVIMDWKLEGSGEEVIIPERVDNARKLGAEDAIKFTIRDNNDFASAMGVYELMIRKFDEDEKDEWNRPTFYYGPVWGTITPAQLVEHVQKYDLPWTLNLQTHNMIWDRSKRGI